MDCVRRRGKVYCAVITVPADLVLLIGKRQIWRSLKTKNYDNARLEARKLLVTVEQLFFKMRGNMDSRLINAMVAEYGLRKIADTDKARIGVKTSGGAEYNEYMQYRNKVLQVNSEATSTAMQGVTNALHRPENRR